eukprot:CAMPEP_0170557594 /NCGR_PEP_ID=MMETSP0211-20121228/28101_1 /TAXON_ID=311385 /ORGANISM="Pseudokeronopsis sp., Strain OXSARD2" /LENGTH=33 /DNA_ID= /DNA_START= /DNA_END= /DNA_ORIENTATION=
MAEKKDLEEVSVNKTTNDKKLKESFDMKKSKRN